MLLLFYLHYRVCDCVCVCVCGCAESPRGTRARELQRVGFSSWGACGLGAVWHVGSFEPESPALEGRFLTSGPPGKSLFMFKWLLCIWFHQWLEREKHLRYLTHRTGSRQSSAWSNGMDFRWEQVHAWHGVLALREVLQTVLQKGLCTPWRGSGKPLIATACAGTPSHTALPSSKWAAHQVYRPDSN